jgi:Tfp pilus assembly protein PilX
MRSKEISWTEGFALPAALLVLLMLSALSAAMILVVTSETRIHTSDAQNTQAYYGAEAAMEKMMTDLNALYQTQQAPAVSAIEALGNSSHRPSLSGISYTDYSFTVPNVSGVPTRTTKTISSGPNQGLIAQITPITLTVTAQQANGAEVKMIRSIEVALIPVFQFGSFSDTDLSYFPSKTYTLGGRVHTNGNLWVQTSTSTGKVVFRSKVTAAGEIIRYQMSNGNLSSPNWAGPVLIPTAPNGCEGLVASASCRDLDEGEGSRVQGLGSAVNPNWNILSTSTYNGWVLSGSTGAKPLTLPFTNSSVKPIEIIHRPAPGEDPTSAVGQSRLYNQAQIRVLLSDDPAELPGGAGDSNNVQLANVGTYASGVPVAGALNTYFAEGKYFATNAGGCSPVDTDWVPRTTPVATGCTSWPLIDGYLRVEAKQSDGTYTAVTREWLELGFARDLSMPDSEAGVANSVHPNAILILQQLADRNGNSNLTDSAYSSGGTVYVGESSTVAGAGAINNWYPINMYDTREGELRAPPAGTITCGIGGIMNMVELDVRNLRGWLLGTIGATGTNTESASQNGYILYFSDRRGMLANGSGNKVGEYGYEDIINPSDSAGNPDSLLDADSAEDVNQNVALDVYGRANLGDGFIQLAQGGDTSYDVPRTSRVSAQIARKNRVSGARHGLMLINGSLGNLPTKADGSGGFTVACENAVYVKGNYNAGNSGFGDPHAEASIIADAVVTLSNNWTDLNSFNNPTAASSRVATNTWHRMAIAAGKNRTFAHPAWSSDDHLGTDGGVITLMRYLESWSSINHNYRGSLVNFYYAQYNNSIQGAATSATYGAPNRLYDFDTDFLNPATLPPGTPRFQDFVNLGYQQVFTP